MKYFLARLAGARADVLQKLPGAVAKQSAMGAVLLTTAGFATISAAYALNITGVAGGAACVVAGLVWGVAILNLDRMLVLGLSGEKQWRKTVMLALPRVLLAIVIGVVISTPLMLKVFETEISAQLNKNILTAQDELRSEINGSTANADLAAAETRLAELRTLINAGPTADPSGNPKVKEVRTEIEKLKATAAGYKAEADKLRAAAVAEEEGSGGTGVAGCAAMCVEKKRLAAEAEGRWQATLAEISAKEGDVSVIARGLETSLIEESKKAIGDAERELPGVEKKVAQLREQIIGAQDTSHALEQANTGIIARLKALDDLSAASPMAKSAHMMVALLFMCMEILPVLFKVLSNFGSKGQYDNVLEVFEKEEERTATADVTNRELTAGLRRDAALDAEKQRIEQQQKTILRINEAVVDHQSEVVDEALAEWTAHARRASAQRLGAWANGLSGAGGTSINVGSGGARVGGTSGGFSAPTTPSAPANGQRTTLGGPGAHLPDPGSL